MCGSVVSAVMDIEEQDAKSSASVKSVRSVRSMTEIRLTRAFSMFLAIFTKTPPTFEKYKNFIRKNITYYGKNQKYYTFFTVFCQYV